MTTHIASTNRTELSERRQQLRRQRRFRLLQHCWRSLAVVGLTAGAVWLTTRPAWVIQDPTQIEIEGNQLVSATALRSLLPMEYPQALLDIQPQVIASHLEQQAPIAQVTVTRHLIPPGLTIQVQERHPVAIALPEPHAAEASSAAESNGVLDPNQSGLLDAQGVWMALDGVKALNDSLELPKLKVRGLTAARQQEDWPTLYEAVRQSPVQVSEIDWREPNNLVLHTELGIVHLGPYSAQFPQQLVALDQMRRLPEHLNGQKIAYINLQNPQSPTLEIASGR